MNHQGHKYIYNDIIMTRHDFDWRYLLTTMNVNQILIERYKTRITFYMYYS